MQPHDLGPIREALPPIGDQVGLRLAPTGQRRRPLPRSTQIEDLLAGLDRDAVHAAGHEGRHLSGGDGDHGLVEQPHAGRRLPQTDQRPALTVPGQGHQVRIAEAGADLDGLAEVGVRGRGVLVETLNRGRHQQPPTLHAVEVALLDHAPGPGEPAPAAGDLAHRQELRAQPQGAPGGASQIPEPHALMVGAGPDVGAFLVPTDHVRRHRQPLQIVELERRILVRRRQLGVRIPPRLPHEGCPPSIERLFMGHAHRLSKLRKAVKTGSAVMSDNRWQASPRTTNACQSQQRGHGHDRSAPETGVGVDITPLKSATGPRRVQLGGLRK